MTDAADPPCTIIDTQGTLPPFWDRNVTFYANLLAIFFENEGQMAKLQAEISEADSYGGRLIPVLNLIYQGEGVNTLVLERAPDPALCDYFAKELRLSLPETAVVRHAEYLKLGAPVADDLHRIGSADWLDGYVTDAVLEAIAARERRRTISTPAGSRDGNNKLKLHRWLEQEGFPTVATEYPECPADVPACAMRLRALGFRAGVLKAPVGASGIGMVKIPDLTEVDLNSLADHLFFEGPCLLQGWLEPGTMGVRQILSPSVQIFLDSNGGYLYDCTEQILSQHSVHEGNESPPPYLGDFPGVRGELFSQAKAAAQWLHACGYRGTASADFLLVDYDELDSPVVYICELNARVTGATYPSVLARHFTPQGAWLLRNLRLTRPASGQKVIEMLRRRGHLYLPGESAGVLPINFNLGPDNLVHKGQFLCLAPQPDKCRAFLEFAEGDLPVEWTFDRD